MMWMSTRRHGGTRGYDHAEKIDWIWWRDAPRQEKESIPVRAHTKDVDGGPKGQHPTLVKILVPA